MKNKTILFLSASALAFAIGSNALAQHAGDVGLQLLNNHIVTGLFNQSGEVDGGLFTEQRVFGADLGELFLNFANEPGFDSVPGTFPVPSSITFNVLGAMRLWDGTAFGSTIPASQMSIGFGPATPLLTPLADIFTPGFSLSVGSNGEWHRHLEFTLQSPALDGIYLLPLSLVGNQPTMQESLPFWIIFNQNMPESEHDEAIAWTNNNLVPLPGSAMLLTTGGVLCTRRRRQAR